VLGARAVAVRDIQEWTIHAGNPAKFLRNRVLRQPAPTDVAV
jgi:acetyltransferase-like isoleucine patch superfamily enzyme